MTYDQLFFINYAQVGAMRPLPTSLVPAHIFGGPPLWGVSGDTVAQQTRQNQKEPVWTAAWRERVGGRGAACGLPSPHPRRSGLRLAGLLRLARNETTLS